MNFIFSCWQYLSLVRFAHSWEILSALEDKIRIPAQPCNILYLHMFCSRCRACVVFFNRHLEEHYKQSVLVVQLLHVEESYLINELITQRIVNSINILIIWKHFGNKLAGNLTLNDLLSLFKFKTTLVHVWWILGVSLAIYGASDISRKKKQNFAGFSGANSRKNRPISRDFRGKKVKIRGKIGRFRRIFAGQKSKFAEKSADFAGF